MDMANKIIKELDMNQDGKIEFHEFEKFMKDGDNFVNLDEGEDTCVQPDNWGLSAELLNWRQILSLKQVTSKLIDQKYKSHFFETVFNQIITFSIFNNIFYLWP